MKFGVCTGLENASIFAKAGFSYIELNVVNDLKPEEPEIVFETQLKLIKAAPLPARTACCFVPGHLKIVGPEVDDERLEHYAQEAFERAGRAGISTIVFGSGGARRIPEGFDAKKAFRQLVDFGTRIGPLAKAANIVVAVEPLNSAETNTINTLAEGVRYIREVDHSNVKLLVDAYHWSRENETVEAILAAGPLLAHAHIATYTSRCAPGREACDFTDFFSALHESGYNGTLSIEGSWSNTALEARSALDQLEYSVEQAHG